MPPILNSSFFILNLFHKHWRAGLLLLPAVATILVWAYIPLVRGAAMAFYDYRIFGASTWVFLDNFANLLWDADWWRALLTSARYSVLVISMTFLPPVLLALTEAVYLVELVNGAFGVNVAVRVATS